MSTGKIKVPTTNDDLIPWTLPIARLICVNFDGSERPAFLCKAGAKAYGLPDGFATGALLNLDTTDLGEVKRFIEAYGLPVSPYAGEFERVEKRYISNDEFSDNPIGDGFEKWQDALDGSQRSVEIRDAFDLSLFNHYKGRDGSAGTEAANLIQGIRKNNEQVILMDDLLSTISIMQVAALLFACKSAFGPKAYDMTIKLLTKLPNNKSVMKHFGQLSVACQLPVEINSKINEHDLQPNVIAARIVASRYLESLEAPLAAFLDLALHPYPENHRIILDRTLLKLAKIDLEPEKQFAGSLTRAFTAQLLEYLQSNQAWRSCELCKRPYKIRQQTMHALTSPEAAKKEQSKPRRTTKKQKSYCTKAHEEHARRMVQAERQAIRRMDRKARGFDSE